MRSVIALSGVVAAAVIAGAAWWVGRDRGSDDVFASCRATAIGTGVASIGGPMSLIDENGVAVTEADIFTKPTLVYFGYTFCPDICPADNARNAEAIDLLAAAGHDVQMAFISVDPERDDPERLRDFTDFLHPKALGYTGTMEEIRAAAKAYKAYFKKEEDGDPEYYVVDHSTFTYLMLPDTGFAEFYRRDMTAGEMAESVGCFLDAAGG